MLSFKSIIFSLNFCFATICLGANLITQNLNYNDAAESIKNPDRGWYRTQGLRLKETDNKAVDIRQPLTHLRVDISAFSEKGIQKIDNSKAPADTIYGKSIMLTEDALNAFSKSFENARNANCKVIVRVSYDIDGRGKQDPPQEIILTHIKQLAKIYSENADVISYVELGMYGSWGEQHTSNNGSNTQIAEALTTMLQNTPAKIKVGVRRPDIVAYWLGVQSTTTNVGYENFDINSPVFLAAVKAKGDTIFRVGMYNDGYLGSSTDLGTVTMGNPQLTREMMVRWLEKYSKNTPYGGEMVANYNGDKPMNTAHYLSYEGFRTHTSYLNWEWHYETIQNMKDSILGQEFGKGFRQLDSEYVGKTAYQYVEDHLGYRYVLRESKLIDTVDASNKFLAKIKIQNVGFGNLTQKTTAKLLIAKTEGENSCAISDSIILQNVDFRNINSRTLQINQNDTTLVFDGINEVEINENLKLKSNISPENYFAFLKIGDIIFANKQKNPCEGNTFLGIYLGKFFADLQKNNSQKIKTYSKNFDNKNSRIVIKSQQVQANFNKKNYKINGSLLNQQ